MSYFLAYPLASLFAFVVAEKKVLSANRARIGLFIFDFDKIVCQTSAMEGMWTILVGGPNNSIAFFVWFQTDCAQISDRFFFVLLRRLFHFFVAMGRRDRCFCVCCLCRVRHNYDGSMILFLVVNIISYYFWNETNDSIFFTIQLNNFHFFSKDNFKSRNKIIGLDPSID